MEQVYTFITDKIKLGNKGQVTIPKKIRDESNFKKNDTFILKRMPSGTMTLEKQQKNDPYDMMFKAIAMAPKFNADEAWEEVRAERKRERS